MEKNKELEIKIENLSNINNDLENNIVDLNKIIESNNSDTFNLTNN